MGTVISHAGRHKAEPGPEGDDCRRKPNSKYVGYTGLQNLIEFL